MIVFTQCEQIDTLFCSTPGTHIACIAESSLRLTAFINEVHWSRIGHFWEKTNEKDLVFPFCSV